MKFVHLRSKFDPKDKMWDDPTVLRPSIAVSIGYQVVRDEMGFYLIGQIARCKMGDQFNKKIARKIIEGRMEKRGPLFNEPLHDGWTDREVYTILDQLYNPDYGSDLIFI